MKNFFDKEKLSEQLHSGKQQKKVKSHIPFRLNFIFLIIFFLFVALIGQLAYLQIANGEAINQKIKASSSVTISGTTPRGMIYDSTGKLLVGNKANMAITFTRGNRMTASEILAVANKLNDLIDVPVDSKLTDRDKKDFYLANGDNLKKVQERLTEKQRFSEDQSKVYQWTVDAVQEEELQFDEKALKAATIYKKMNSATALTTVFIKNEQVTDQELAVVGERVSELPGVSTGVDWTRELMTDDTSLKTLIGSISNNGLPAEELDAYLAKGYARNDRVGTSNIEKQYEEVLQGTKSKYEITLDHQGNISKQEEIYGGKKGSNLMLTINAEFQRRLEEILERNYQPLVDAGKAKYSPGIYAVVMDPKSGAVLGMAGIHHNIETNETTIDPSGTYLSAFTPGSVVKPGTLTAGWQSGAITGNESILDQPIQIYGTAVKASIFNPTGAGNRVIDASKALELSSNSYMIQVALKMLGTDYTKNMKMPYVSNQVDVYNKLRKAFNSYGMGAYTGIDLPNESMGVTRSTNSLSPIDDGAKVLDLAFGQFDTYTTLQLAQYAATVANGGKRIEPHVVQGIYGDDVNGELGAIEKAIQPKVLNTVELTDEQRQIIKDGMYAVVHGREPNTTAPQLRDAKIDLSAKTGTAEYEVFENGVKVADTVNSNIVVFGPSDDAQVAMALMLPQVMGDDKFTNITTAKEIMNLYAEMYMGK